MKSPSMPAPPDPQATAAAQTKSNRDTATYQTGLNAVNQVTPYGNLTYSQNGNWAMEGSPPKFTATQTLSPVQQQLLDQSQQADLKMNGIAINQIDKVGDVLSKPVSLNNEATEGRLMELGRKRLDPMFQQQNEQLEQNLMNRGIGVGSKAYDTMHTAQGQKENDAYNSLLLGGRQQAQAEMLTERNQPLNEIIGLLNGQQIKDPSYVSTPQTNVAGTDVAGIIQQNYQNQLGQAQAKAQQQNAMMGGLFGLGGSALKLGMGGFGMPGVGSSTGSLW